MSGQQQQFAPVSRGGAAKAPLLPGVKVNRCCTASFCDSSTCVCLHHPGGQFTEEQSRHQRHSEEYLNYARQYNDAAKAQELAALQQCSGYEQMVRVAQMVCARARSRSPSGRRLGRNSRSPQPGRRSRSPGGRRFNRR